MAQSQSSRERLAKRIRWRDLDEQYLRGAIERARLEDVAGLGFANTPEPGQAIDVSTATLDPALEGRASLRARHGMTVCGLPLAALVLDVYGGRCALTPACEDGAKVDAGEVLGTIEGPVVELLAAERIILNYMQRLSGVATETTKYVDALGGSETRLLDTRKTTPGFRALEKYAFACGGGWNHRLGLWDRVMLKDNHLAAAGAAKGDRLAEAVRHARRRFPHLPIEVEVDRMEQIPPVLEAGADIIMLDNFPAEDLREAVQLVGGRALTEASGGVTLATLPALASLGLDYISTGAPVHQSRWCDIGLDWEA